MNRRAALLAAGPLAGLVLALVAPSNLPPGAAAVLGVAAWMAVWWLTEPVPLAATSLLPIVLFPLLGVRSAKDAAAPYANELVFLFLAGFLLAAAPEKWKRPQPDRLRDRLGYGRAPARVFRVIARPGRLEWISTPRRRRCVSVAPPSARCSALAGPDGTRTALMLRRRLPASNGGRRRSSGPLPT